MTVREQLLTEMETILASVKEVIKSKDYFRIEGLADRWKETGDRFLAETTDVCESPVNERYLDLLEDMEFLLLEEEI